MRWRMHKLHFNNGFSRISPGDVARNVSSTVFFRGIVLITALLLMLPLFARAQDGDDDGWQQRVRYDMNVSLLADRHKMRGVQRLRYTNNSPDTLRRVYYHLYFNAFNPNSMMAERNRHLPDPDGRIVPRIFNLGPDEVGYHRIQRLTQDGEPLDYEITDTVVRVDLAEPILPGETTTFRMRFRSQVPLQTRRSGRDNREGIDYSMTQWYPKMAEYDEQGWHADPYVGREFYAPYGTFNVNITLPAHYTIGATGALQNADDIGHGYANTGTYRTAQQSFAEGDSLTWSFYAENVHDFAWSADPDYIHENIQENGQRYHLLYQPGVEDGWEKMSDWVPEIMTYIGDEVGPYPYPQFTVAQGGDGGMEYPMIVLITGRRSPGSLLGVTAHEAAHEWFYGVLGSNETDYAWMDEGFTSYISPGATAQVRGRNVNRTGNRISYLYAKDRGLFEPLNTPADWYTTNLAYGVASYPSGAMFVDMMKYVIGDENQSEWLHEYYDRFKFDHPNPRDLEKIAEDVSGLRLDWYFEQFLDMNRSLDYELDEIDAEQTNDGWKTRIEMERKDEVAMPIDLKLTYADGSTQWVNVPLGIMQGHKPVNDSWIVAEPWLWTFPEYAFEATLPKQVVEAEIDPTGMMPDENRLNNTAELPVQADFLEAPAQSWFDYSVGYRPLAQYANDFGPGVGLQARGQYFFGEHQTRFMLKAWPQVIASDGRQPNDLPDDANVSFWDGIDYEASYANNVEALGTDAMLRLTAEKHLGILENRLSVERPLTSYEDNFERSVSVSVAHQFSPTVRQFPANRNPFPPYFSSNTLIPEQHIATAKLQFKIDDGPNRLYLTGEAGGPLSSNFFDNALNFFDNALRLSLEAARAVTFGPGRAQAAFRFGMGPDDLLPFKRFRLGAASREGRWQNDAFRSVAAAFNDPREEAHLFALNGTGPVAYLLSGIDNNSPGFRRNPLPSGPPLTRNIIEGRLSLSTRLPIDNSFLRPLRLEAFSGIGTFWNENDLYPTIRPPLQQSPSSSLGELIADAGLGARYDVSALDPLDFLTEQSDVLQDLSVVAQFPLWASELELTELPRRITNNGGQDEFAFRWLLGIQVNGR
jgi:hypothetical protein